MLREGLGVCGCGAGVVREVVGEVIERGVAGGVECVAEWLVWVCAVVVSG